MAIELTGNDLTVDQFRAVAVSGENVTLAAEARRKVEAARRVIEKLAESDAVVYGVTTGCGALAEVKISHDEMRTVQLNLVRSHACGVGEPLGEPETRGMMLLRANVLAKGYSGVRPVVIETLCEMLNRRVHPVIPAKGSVGASGDLAPLAHLALVLIGEGEAVCDGQRLPGGEAMRRAGIPALVLEVKEGISILNGTQGMLSLGLLALLEAENLVDTADVAASLTLDALRGTPVAFDRRIQQVRPFAGQARTAHLVEELNKGSEIRESHRECARVQDAYSLRCIPQVHGAVRDTLTHVRRILEVELNSATDNPLVFAESGEVLSGGNFHGEPLAMAMDFLAIAAAALGGISERRIERMVNPALSGLPPFLTAHAGLNSGFMLAQVTAAALASENKTLSHPASVDSIPTSGNKEDYVSMGMGGALKAGQVLVNVSMILAIELLAAAQGIGFLEPLKTGRLAQRALALVRSVSPKLVEDRPLAPDIERVRQLLLRREFQKIVAAVPSP